MHPPRDRSQLSSEAMAGFSLIEAGFVMLTLGIALAMTMPSFAKFMHSNSVKSSASQLAGHLRLARQKAVTESIQHIVSWNATTDTYRIVRDLDGDGVVDTNEPFEGPFRLAEHVELANASPGGFSASSVLFLPNGSASESGAVVLSEPNGSASRIELLAPTGQTKVR